MTLEQKLELTLRLRGNLRKASTMAALALGSLLLGWLASLLGETWQVKVWLGSGVLLLCLIALLIAEGFARRTLATLAATKRAKETLEFPDLPNEPGMVLTLVFDRYPGSVSEGEARDKLGLSAASVRASFEYLLRDGMVKEPKHRLVDPMSETGYNSSAGWRYVVSQKGIDYIFSGLQ